MANFLDSLGFGGGTDVYVAVSSNDKMEMCVPLKGKGEIQAYAQTTLAYNNTAREIADYDEFKTKILELLNICGVSPQKANIHIGLPVVWFGHKDDIQLMHDQEAIQNIIIGELEQTYIFKKKEPVPYWFDGISESSEFRKIFYTAIQAEAVDAIRGVLKEIGATLSSIDCTIFAYLRSLYATGKISTQIEANAYSWNLMTISENGFKLYGMQNDKMTEYYEEPIILTEVGDLGDDVYAQVANAAQIALLSSPANSLVIISETDYISAERLSKQLQFSGEIVVLEENKFRQEPVSEICYTLPEEQQLNVSMYVLGLFAGVGMFPWGANFITEDEEDVILIPLTSDITLKLTPKKALKYAIILFLATVIPALILFALAGGLNGKSNNEIQTLDTQLQEVDTQLSAYEQSGGDNFNPLQETEKVLKNNRLKIMSYAALGESIPKDLYLTYFMTGDDGYVDIQGCAKSVEDVYVFFQNLKDSLVEAKLRLNKLDLKAGSLDTVINNNASTIDTAPYVFEITNMSDSQLATFMQALNAESAAEENSEQEGQEQTEQPQPAEGNPTN